MRARVSMCVRARVIDFVYICVRSYFICILTSPVTGCKPVGDLLINKQISLSIHLAIYPVTMIPFMFKLKNSEKGLMHTTLQKLWFISHASLARVSCRYGSADWSAVGGRPAVPRWVVRCVLHPV